jgi:hypothetical protein
MAYNEKSNYKSASWWAGEISGTSGIKPLVHYHISSILRTGFVGLGAGAALRWWRGILKEIRLIADEIFAMPSIGIIAVITGVVAGARAAIGISGVSAGRVCAGI